MGLRALAANSCAAMQWFYDMPWPLSLLTLLVAIIGLSLAGHIAFRRMLPLQDLLRHNEVAGFMISIVGVVYAVLLGFVVVITWEQYDNARARVEREASAVSDIHNLLAIYGARANEAENALDTYLRLTISEEWPAMREGGVSPAARLALRDVERRVAALKPIGNREETVFSRTLEMVVTLDDLRRERISDNQNSLPPAMWFALFFGAFITITFGYLFGVEVFRAHLAMTAAVAAAIGLQLFLTMQLDFPFRGTLAIPPSALVDVQHEFALQRQ
jgi:hypothetical protein